MKPPLWMKHPRDWDRVDVLFIVVIAVLFIAAGLKAAQ